MTAQINKSTGVHLNGGQGRPGSSGGSSEAGPITRIDAPRGSFPIHWPKEEAKCQVTKRRKRRGSGTWGFPGEEQGSASFAERRHHAGNVQARGWCTRVDFLRQGLRLAVLHGGLLHSPPWTGETRGGKGSWEASQNLFLQGTPHLSSPLPCPELFSNTNILLLRRDTFQPRMKYPLCLTNTTVFLHISLKLTFLQQPTPPVLTRNTLISEVWLSRHFSCLCLAC